MDKKYDYKNKGKKNNIYNTYPTPKPVIQKPVKKGKTEWFYMTPCEVNAKMISDLFKIKGETEVDLWEELNILQISLQDKTTVDFEPITEQFSDPSDASFIKNRGIKTIFSVTMEEESFELAKPFFKTILEELEGFLCADSQDFKPQYSIDELV